MIIGTLLFKGLIPIHLILKKSICCGHIQIYLSVGTITGTYFLASDGWQYEDEGAVGPENPPPVEEDDDSGFLESIKNFVSKISDSILNLPKAISDLIKDALKEIFVPDTDYVQNAISSFSADLRNNLNIDTSAF